MKKRLRWGYTTGACAAAAAKAATLLLLQSPEPRAQNADRKRESPGSQVEIPFPDGKRARFKVHSSKLLTLNSGLIARASIIKDAGDDPDVTNGAEIVAEVKIQNTEHRAQSTDKGGKSMGSVIIKGGPGVGIVTKPGLPVPVGEAAINPVPRRMIGEAVAEAITEHRAQSTDKSRNNLGSGFCALGSVIEVTISVVNGENIARKTLNPRLGILGGISILGTTGHVKPVSAEAWTATITSSMDVAGATGQQEVVLSAGRTSERAHMKRYSLPEESYVLMGDHLAFSLQEAKRHGFRRIHLCAQWAKMLKIAMATPQTHVRFGAINIKKAMDFLSTSGADVPHDQEFNTAREIFEYIVKTIPDSYRVLERVCSTARDYAEEITGGIPVTAHLVSYGGEIIASSE